MKTINILRPFIFLPVVCLIVSTSSINGLAAEKTLIFPIPQQMELTQDVFTIDETVSIIVPDNGSEKDISLAHFLVGELSEKYGIALKIENQKAIPKGRKIILMGTIDNPLIKKYCSGNKIEINKANPGTEGYILQVDGNLIVIAGCDDAGAFYGLQSLRQLIQKGNGTNVQGLKVRDWPNMPFRAIRLYVPGPENIAFFNRFLKDFMALYKYNKLVMEVNCMRLDKHPEVNAGWIEFVKYMQYTRSNATEGIYGELKNSSHYDAGDGYIIEKEDVRSIVNKANKNFIEVIPEIPSLSHGYYLLTRHPELAEYPGDKWPDTYCSSNPATYQLLFDVFDEYLEVMQPKMVHIGHDEWWGAPVDACPLCKSKDRSELFAQDVNKIYSYLSNRKIKAAMWGDYMLESVRDTGFIDKESSTGRKYQTPGAVRPEVVKSSIPKDILMFNWFWDDETKDMELNNFGFTQVYGNFHPGIRNWEKRIKNIAVTGGAPSSWATTDEYIFGKDLVFDFLGCSNLLWSTKQLSSGELYGVVAGLMPSVRAGFQGKRIPSRDGDPIIPVDIALSCNIPKNFTLFNRNLSALNKGEIRNSTLVFNISGSGDESANSLIAVSSQGKGEIILPREVNSIPIKEDVSSLIFLHACATPAENKKAFFNMPDQFDSSDLLGYYEIVYDDGLKDIIPVQYGVNILEWNSGAVKSGNRGADPGENNRAYCYSADPVECSGNMADNPITFYAFEWVNKRMGKVIKEVNLHGSVNYQTIMYDFDKVATKPMESNAIILAGISKVAKREPFKPEK